MGAAMNIAVTIQAGTTEKSSSSCPSAGEAGITIIGPA